MVCPRSTSTSRKSNVCWIGGAGSVPSIMALNNSSPDTFLAVSGGTTPYRIEWSALLMDSPCKLHVQVSSRTASKSHSASLPMVSANNVAVRMKVQLAGSDEGMRSVFTPQESSQQSLCTRSGPTNTLIPIYLESNAIQRLEERQHSSYRSQKVPSSSGVSATTL